MACRLSSVWPAGAHDYLSERWGNTSKRHGYLIWDDTRSARSFRNLHETFEKKMCDVGTYVTQEEKALTQCELTPLTYILSFTSESSAVLIMFHAGKPKTLSLIHGWYWTQEESLIPTCMNDACDAWLGCISGLLYTAVIIYLNIYKRNVWWCWEQNPHPFHVHSLHIYMLSMCMCVSIWCEFAWMCL